MRDLNAPCTQYLESPYGYVATAAPAWNAAYDLRYAVDPRARMSMRMVDYCMGGWRERDSYNFRQSDGWLDTVEHADITLRKIDESITLPDVESVRHSLKFLIETTIAGDWYVAGFVVCEELGLELLLGYIHDHEKLEEPCKLYATATIIYPVRELHLRFTPSDRRMLESGKPLFRDVAMTEAPDKRNSHDYEDIRVREYYLPKSARPGLCDVRDFMFAGLEGSYVPTVSYTNVSVWPVIDFNS